MAKYVIESPHTPEECLQALDEIAEKGLDVLNKFVWGCAHGEHTGYAYIDAESEKEACALVPEFLQDKAKIIEVSKFTIEQIKSFHEK